MKASKILLILAAMICSCKQSETHFTGGAIQKPGVYQFNDKLIIEISITRALVEYTVKDVSGKLKIETIHPFSDYQSWAFYLDENGIFWVISSDIGYAYFEPDKNGNYIYHELSRKVDVKTLPESIVRDLPEFFD